MPRQIEAIQLNLPNLLQEDFYKLTFKSDASLVDADIILFRPAVLSLYSLKKGTLKGKSVLGNASSHTFKKNLEHWQEEFLTAFNAGKTIFIFTDEVEEFYIDASSYSDKDFTYTSLAAIDPIKTFELYTKSGINEKASDKFHHLASYWEEYKDISYCSVCITPTEGLSPILTSKNGEHVFSAIYHDPEKEKSGHVVFLPHPQFDEIKGLKKYISSTQSEKWTIKGKEVGRKFLSHLIQIDKSLKIKEETVEPLWTKNEIFCSSHENSIKISIEQKLKNISTLEEEIVTLQNELKNEGLLKKLVYENGKPLEDAVIESLKILGFHAQNHIDKEGFEYDILFKADETPLLIGEVEGKDKKAIDLGKVQQLTSRVDSYYTEAKVFPKAVLFGNASRLKPLDQRGEWFTSHCVNFSKKREVALVKTDDLFWVAKYIKETGDINYAKACRIKITETSGDIVSFPLLPKTAKSQVLL